jgi:hypothetical protein
VTSQRTAPPLTEEEIIPEIEILETLEETHQGITIHQSVNEVLPEVEILEILETALTATPDGSILKNEVLETRTIIETPLCNP